MKMFVPNKRQKLRKKERPACNDTSDIATVNSIMDENLTYNSKETEIRKKQKRSRNCNSPLSNSISIKLNIWLMSKSERR